MKSATTTIRAYQSRHTLWQAMGGASIRLIRSWIDPTIIVQLIVGGMVAATESKRYRSNRKADAAFDAASTSGKFAI